MNTSESCDVLLVGNEVEDWIIDGENEPKLSWGGIYNVKRSLERCGIFDIKIEPTDFGKAYIKLDRENSSKWVHADLSLVKREPKIYDAKWTHIAYGNSISWYPYFPQKQGVISVDLCNEKDFYSSNHGIDYIFCSAEEFYGPSIYCEKETKVIEHSPKSITIWQNKKNIYQTELPLPIKGINVLGAGDHFAASFISHKLKCHDDKESIKFAAINTREWLISR